MFRIYVDDSTSYLSNLNEQGNILYSPNLQKVKGFDVISPKFTEELNKAGSVEFTLPKGHVLYNKLSKLKTTVYVTENDRTPIWIGRILHDEKDFYNRKSVYCEGYISFLNDSVIRPYSYSGGVQKYLSFLLGKHNEQVNDNRKLWFSGITENNGAKPDGFNYVEDSNMYIVRSNSDYTSTLDEMTNKLINHFNGMLLFRWANNRIYFSYVNTGTVISDQVIHFGENLLDITEYITAENVFTVLIPLGKQEESEDRSEGKRLTIESVNNGKDYIENQTAINLFGRIWKTQKWDDVTVASNLLSKGREFLNGNISMSVTLTIKAVDLHYINVDVNRIKLGDMVRVVSEPHGLDTYFLCSKIVHDLEDPSKDEFTFGVGFNAMTDQQVAQGKMTNVAYSTSESNSSTISQINTNVAENYVSKQELTSFQSQVNTNFDVVNNKLLHVYHYKGTVSSFFALPSSGNDIGDVWNVDDTGANYAWTGSDWDKLSEDSVDLTGYVTKEVFDSLVARVSALETNPPSGSGSGGQTESEILTSSFANNVLQISGFANDPSITIS